MLLLPGGISAPRALTPAGHTISEVEQHVEDEEFDVYGAS